MESLEKFKLDHAAVSGKKNSVEKLISALVPRGLHPDLPHGCRIVREIADTPAPGEELLLPFYLDEFSLPKIKEQLHRWYEKGGRTVRISSLSHLALLREYPDLILKTCMPLPVCNSLTAAELAEYGVVLIQPSLELGASEWSELAEKSPLPCEIYRFGRPVLLSTRAELPVQGAMSDSKGEIFRVEKSGILTQVMSEKVMSVPVPPEADAEFLDYRHASGKEKNTARFNYDISLA